MSKLIPNQAANDVPENGARLIYSANRDTRYMPIYEVSQHPLVDRSRNPNGRILIAMVDSTVSGMKAALDLEQDKHMAKGSDDHLVAQG